MTANEVRYGIRAMLVFQSVLLQLMSPGAMGVAANDRGRAVVSVRLVSGSSERSHVSVRAEAAAAEPLRSDEHPGG